MSKSGPPSRSKTEVTAHERMVVEKTSANTLDEYGDANTAQATADGLPPLRAVITTHHLAAKKSLGQNFILDLNLTRRIARSTGALAGATIIEVGPGPGGLTRGLLMEGAAHVVAVERDARCLPALAEIAAHHPGQLTVHAGDALRMDWPALLAPLAESGAAADVRIIANLPYGVATALLTGWLAVDDWPPWYHAMALMFQREVAERIVASPGNKAYGRLAVLAQWRTEPSISLHLPPQAFTPPPKVDSAVVLFRPRLTPLDAGSPATLGRVTAAAFGQRRKMLRQSLKSLVRMPEVLLARAEIEPTARAEQIDVAGYARLSLALAKIEGSGT